MTRLDRRRFLRSSLAAGVATSSASLIRARRVWGANERLNIGVIGVGGRGAGDLAAVAHENIVALCDVDEGRLNAAADKHRGAKTFFDYRQLIDHPGIDAVVVATPDHHHAPATMRALQAGLHVYCEKPLTHTVSEARLLAQTASKLKLATQMGTQNHEHPGYLRLVELIQKDVIGPIHEVHVVTDRPGRFWSQGLDVPQDKPPVPANLQWDLWLGPAEARPYHPAYVPFKWRGWWDFGCGAIGDMAIHLMDPSFWALELGGPVKVTSSGPAPHPHSGPTWMITKFEFGARTSGRELPPVDVYWYEGEAKVPAAIAEELPMNGSLFIGQKGRIAIEHGNFPKLLPQEQFADVRMPDPYLPESPGHHQQWINACKHGTPTGSHFGYAGPFTEIVLLGNIAYRVGETITYDPAKTRITDVESANQFLTKSYRSGWKV